MSVAEILTITTNPAVDLAASVPRVVAGPKLYCGPPRVDPGGGGVNVARAIVKLGGEVTALVAVGGAMGARLLGLLAAEGVPTRPVQMPGETRQSLAVTDAATGDQFRISLPGEVQDSDAAARLLTQIAAATPEGGIVVVSGSVAPGLGDDFLQRAQAEIAARTDRLIVDTSRGTLARLIARPTAPVHLLRFDRAEAEIAAGRPMATVTDSASFASELVARGVARIVVTGRGAEGSVMATGAGAVLCRAPQMPVRSAIGAGDALVGAMTLALARGDAPEVALRWGVAAACSTVETEGTALCDRVRTEALFEACGVEPI